MSEIKIQRKTTSVWPWLIPLLIVVAVLLWWLLAREPDPDVALAPVGAPALATSQEAEVPLTDLSTLNRPAGDSLDDLDSTSPTADGPLTDLGAIMAMSPAERVSLIGRRVELTDVAVPVVPSDEVFWVGSTETERLFVTLDPTGVPATAGSPANVTAGQQVSVAGVLRELPSNMNGMRSRWKLDDFTIAALATARVYLAADRVTVLQSR